MVDLDTPATQQQIAELIGVTQQAVSEMMGRGVMAPGLSLRGALMAYTNHMRLMAAGRDGDLARERAELTRVQRERQEIKLALERDEAAPVAVIEQVLATVGRVVSGKLEPLAGQIHKICPQLTPEALVKVQAAIAEACDMAVSASMDALVEPDEEQGGAGDVDELDEEPA